MKPSNNYKSALYDSNLAITAEIDLPYDVNRDSLIQRANNLAKSTHAIQLNDISTTGLHISPLAAASVLIQQGIQPIVQLTCRDRNRIALQSDLLGAGLIGVKNLLLTAGHKMRSEYQPDAKLVFDLKARELVAAAASIRDAEQITSPPDFYIGTTATVIDPAPDWVPDAMISRTRAGAQFVQTQLCFDSTRLLKYLQRLIETRVTWQANVVVSVGVLTSAEHAENLNKIFPGMVIPDAVVNRLRQSSHAEQTGVEICAEMLSELSRTKGIAGVHLSTTGQDDSILQAIALSGLKT